MFCQNCGYNLGESKFCPMCGTKVITSKPAPIDDVKEEPAQTRSNSTVAEIREHTIASLDEVSKHTAENPLWKSIKKILSIIFSLLSAGLYVLSMFGFLGGGWEDALGVVFVFLLPGFLCSFISGKLKKKTKKSWITLAIMIVMGIGLCTLSSLSESECTTSHQWQAATLEKPYTCSVCGATRGELAQPCSECEMTGLIACDNCDELGQATCSVCNGEKLADCPDCQGSGKVSCASCAGSGKGGVEESRCYKCGGNGQVKSTCSNCGGVGSVVIRSYGNTSVDDCLKCGGKGSVYNECTSCDGDGTKKSFKKCNQCDGSGTVKDEQCNGKGKVPCTNCNDNGIEECHLCKKTKQLTCNNCGGTGLIQNTPVFSVTLTAFNLEENNNRKVCSSIPSSSSYLHYKFKFESLESGKTYTLRHRTQWPGQEATLADWVWKDVKDGDIRGCEWKNGYTTSNADTLVIEILNDETGEVLGKFEMEVVDN